MSDPGRVRRAELTVDVDSNAQAYTDQVDAIEDAIKTYGTDHIEGVRVLLILTIFHLVRTSGGTHSANLQIIVGNEYILNTASTGSLTSSIYLSSVKTITDHIQEVNTTIKALNLDKHLPIGTSDAGSLLSTTLATGIDFFMANVHPWFATVGVDTAAVWTNQFFHEFDIVRCALVL